MDAVALRWLAGLVGPCPECRNGTLQPVPVGEQTNFLCPNCGCCWHGERDWVSQVNPLTCPGCPSRDQCTAPRHRTASSSKGRP